MSEARGPSRELARETPNMTGPIFILSAPSGTGKTTILDILARKRGLERGITCTTRKPRRGERNGVDYHFLDESRFRRLVEEDGFAEWALVYGNYYGTPRAALEEGAGKRPVLLALDTQGAASVRAGYPERTVLVGLLPPSREELARRLRNRGTLTAEREEDWRERLEAACREMETIREKYDHLIVNDDPDRAADEFYRIITGSAGRKTRNRGAACPGKDGCKPASW